MILKYILKFLCLFGIAFSLLIITANAEELKEKVGDIRMEYQYKLKKVIVMNCIHLQRLQ